MGLPREKSASGRVDWFYVGLVAGPCMMATLLMGLYLLDRICHTSILPASVPTQRTLGSYVAAHSRADRKLELFGLVTAVYPVLLWVLVRIMTRGWHRSRAPR